MRISGRAVRRAVVTTVAVVALAVPLTAASPGAAAPDPVEVSADGRWFTLAGEPFFWLADRRRDLFTGLDRAEVERYLDARAAQGFTVVQAPAPAADRAADVEFVMAAATRHGLRVAVEPGGSAPFLRARHDELLTVPHPFAAPFVRSAPVTADPAQVRADAYRAVFDGAAGFTHPPGASDTVAEQLGHLRALVLSRPYLSRVPAREVLTAGAVGDGARATRDAAGSHLMVYSPGGQEFAVDTSGLSGTALRGWWFDPRSGTAIDIGSVQRGESVFAYPPQTGTGDAGLDWVLVVDDVAAGFGPPGR